MSCAALVQSMNSECSLQGYIRWASQVNYDVTIIKEVPTPGGNRCSYATGVGWGTAPNSSAQALATSLRIACLMKAGVSDRTVKCGHYSKLRAFIRHQAVVLRAVRSHCGDSLF